MSGEGKRYSGQVIWFNPIKGFGFIRPSDASADDKAASVFVHQSSIKSPGFRSLGEDEKVEYSLESDDKGRVKAVNVTGPSGGPVVGSRRNRRLPRKNENGDSKPSDGGSNGSRDGGSDRARRGGRGGGVGAGSGGAGGRGAPRNDRQTK